jgi:hypothetical protein
VHCDVGAVGTFECKKKAGTLISITNMPKKFTQIGGGGGHSAVTNISKQTPHSIFNVTKTGHIRSGYGLISLILPITNNVHCKGWTHAIHYYWYSVTYFYYSVITFLGARGSVVG